MKLYCVFELDQETDDWNFVGAFSEVELAESFIDDYSNSIFNIVETKVNPPPRPDRNELNEEELFAPHLN